MKKLVYLLFAVSIILVGCGKEVDNMGDGELKEEIVTNEPINFTKSKIGSGGTLPDYLNADNPYIVVKASAKEAHAKYWKDFGIKESEADIDFEKYDTYYITTFGSSSCPISFKDFIPSGETMKVTIAELEPNVMCTMDYVSNTSVLKVDKATKIKEFSFINKDEVTPVSLWVK